MEQKNHSCFLRQTGNCSFYVTSAFVGYCHMLSYSCWISLLHCLTTFSFLSSFVLCIIYELWVWNKQFDCSEASISAFLWLFQLSEHIRAMATERTQNDTDWWSPRKFCDKLDMNRLLFILFLNWNRPNTKVPQSHFWMTQKAQEMMRVSDKGARELLSRQDVKPHLRSLYKPPSCACHPAPTVI